ncbi:MAG: hypothetical protein M1827_003115 [Pycnora praestabilis]|nr:MAG: hypothetical protein M1827_003115 [Pycnora praestabilis]
MSAQQPLGAVLVIGGCGYLGHHIVSKLLECDPAAQVSVLDVRTDRNRHSSVTYYDGNISSKDDIRSVFEKVQPRVIIHTASPPPFAHDLGFFMKVNVDGTRNLLEVAKECESVEAFVYTSSASVIHDSVSNLVEVDESSPVLYLPDQKEPYNHTKAMAEALVLAANRKNGDMLTIAIRPSGLFGEGDLTTVKPMVEAAAAGKYKFQIGDGKNLFDWTYVGNAAQAHILAAQALLRAYKSSTTLPSSERVDGEAILVTNDEPIPFWEFARSLGAAAGYPTKPEEIRSIPRVVGLAMAAIAEWMVWITSLGKRKSAMTRQSIRYSSMTRTFRIDKAKRRLGYRPLVSMEEAIRRAAESFAKTSKTD